MEMWREMIVPFMTLILLQGFPQSVSSGMKRTSLQTNERAEEERTWSHLSSQSAEVTYSFEANGRIDSLLSSPSYTPSINPMTHHQRKHRRVMRTNPSNFDQMFSIPLNMTNLQGIPRHLSENSRRRHRDVSSVTLASVYSSEAINNSSGESSPSPSTTSLEEEDNPEVDSPKEKSLARAIDPLWAYDFPSGATCRISNVNQRLSPLKYQARTCADCYEYLPPISFEKEEDRFLVRPLRDFTKILIDNATYDRYIANISDFDSPVYKTFSSLEYTRKWVDCCLAAESCCKKIFRVDAETKAGFCPPTWDGWQCWDETEAGTTALNSCPEYIYFRIERPTCYTSVPKFCEANETWAKHPKYPLREWTNYSTCTNHALETHKKKANVHVMAYTLSIIALIPALIIFFSYSQLRVHRIILHQNLFISFLLNGLFVIAVKNFIILNDLNIEKDEVQVSNQNTVWCRLLFIMTKYSRLTNYMWMFCEGYYLHKLIAAAFAEQESLLVFYLIGWVFPIIPTAIYAGLRLYDANEKCWVIPEETYEWVVNIPSLLSLLANLGFIIHIIYVLVMKLRATHNTNEPSQYRKAVRATVVLLPLFGLHFLFTIYRPPASAATCEWFELYNYVDYVLDGLQGFLVSLNFCYVNGEVISLLKRTYSRARDRYSSTTCCQRQIVRLNNRNARGRSVVSTHYSSVPASPETSRSLTRLTITNNEINKADSAPVTSDNCMGPDGKKLILTNGRPNSHSLLVTNVDDEQGGWTEIKLDAGGNSGNNTLEMQQAFTLNPSPTPSSGGTAFGKTSNSSVRNNNGIVGEHQL